MSENTLGKLIILSFPSIFKKGPFDLFSLGKG